MMLEFNTFIKLAIDIQNGIDKYKPEVHYKSKLHKLFKIKEQPERTWVKPLQEYESYVKINITDAPSISFKNLWMFCQFVRYAEKVYFYNNDISNKLYVDSAMEDPSSRVFMINEKDKYKIVFALEKQTKPGNNANENFEVIKMVVSRFYGKKMVNQFIIVDGNIKYNDISDSYLINNINKILSKSITKVLTDISNLIIKDYLHIDDKPISYTTINVKYI